MHAHFAEIEQRHLEFDAPAALGEIAAAGLARSLAEAEPELEKLVRSGYRTVVAFPRRGEGERAAYNLGRMKARWLGEDAPAGAGSGPAAAAPEPEIPAAEYAAPAEEPAEEPADAAPDEGSAEQS